ncbi:P1 family peptidase [Nocardioides sp. GY 10127]|uniref:DmpA family aminopeptidase n=1 Tax=Nocardioides sp. GY 10127 TaxID=2569762 RepID=UPI0010A7A8C2|nr:P1 family peptidase [Nocardioides sp. GY 10127]TIC84157.1 P1 family peptidase [Nocardioides sp. GY 10127]
MPRLRHLGLSVGRLTPGPLNAITDVEGVRVGHRTVVEDRTDAAGRPVAVRTGVTVVQPRPGPARSQPCYAGSATLNGNGEMTGLEWVRESGLLTTAVAITNTHSVGVVRDALVADDSATALSEEFWSMPVVAETWDGLLNDLHGQHVTAQHVRDALADASGGPVAEGCVGGGTGMVCHGFKGGIGTASRRLGEADGGWTVGALVQSNYGERHALRVDGVPVGRLIGFDEVPAPGAQAAPSALPPGSGSIIVVLATDAPLLPDQCQRLARRAGTGLARLGGGTQDGSGDIFLAFATGNRTLPPETYLATAATTVKVSTVPHQRLDPLLEAAAEATEEAVLNALLAATTTTGHRGRTVHALPARRLREVMAAYAPGAFRPAAP